MGEYSSGGETKVNGVMQANFGGVLRKFRSGPRDTSILSYLTPYQTSPLTHTVVPMLKRTGHMRLHLRWYGHLPPQDLLGREIVFHVPNRCGTSR